VQFLDAATGLPCLAVRHPRLGHWCGYVGVPPGHPLHGKDRDEVDLCAHGGVNRATACDDSKEEGRGVCHIADAGEPDHVWWFGFDCGHAWDVSPWFAALGFPDDGTYRTLEYVKDVCENLARQLSEAGKEQS
jgi:hypothetical protein